ncbi:MAG TPA: hypothetical protein VK853_07165 [Ilumatobacteraceae bacterium]|nr:hypothetical protein [Ilumatobacteraceae bacterium]
MTNRLTKTLAVTLVAGTAALTLGAGAAHAQDSASSREARIERACARIPNLQTRLDSAEARITGAADVRGSLLWLDTRIQAAADADRSDLVTALTNRRAVREATLAVVQLRQANLAEFAALCDARD